MSPEKFAGHSRNGPLASNWFWLIHYVGKLYTAEKKFENNTVSFALFVSKFNTANHAHPYNNNLHHIAGPSKNNIKLLHHWTMPLHLLQKPKLATWRFQWTTLLLLSQVWVSRFWDKHKSSNKVNKYKEHIPRDPSEKTCCSPNIHQLQSQMLQRNIFFFNNYYYILF